MLRYGTKIRLSLQEREQLSGLAGEVVNPESVADYNAWLRHLADTVWAEDTPEDRLVRAILAGQTLPEDGG